jgi:hypothetical protein
MFASARVTWESRALEQPPFIVAGRQKARPAKPTLLQPRMKRIGRR